MFISGDGVQCNELMNFKGHCYFYGCRTCLVKGRHRIDAYDTDGEVVAGKHGMYFEGRDKELRSRDSLLLKDKSPIYVSIYIYKYVIAVIVNIIYLHRETITMVYVPLVYLVALFLLPRLLSIPSMSFICFQILPKMFFQ